MEDFARCSSPTRPLGPGPSRHAQAVLRTRAEGETFRFSRFRFFFSTHTHDPARVRGPPDLFRTIPRYSVVGGKRRQIATSVSFDETLEGIGSLTTARAVTGRRCCVGGATSAAAETAKARTRAMFLAGELWILLYGLYKPLRVLVFASPLFCYLE